MSYSYVLFSCAALSCAAVSLQAQTYVFETFEAPYPPTSPAFTNHTFATGINNRGAIVGHYFFSLQKPYLYGAGGTFKRHANGIIEAPLRDPVTAQPLWSHWATGINDSGVITGYTSGAPGSNGFIIENGSLATVRFGPGPRGVTKVEGLNNLGDYVGDYYDPDTGSMSTFARIKGETTELRADPKEPLPSTLSAIAWDATIVGCEGSPSKGFLRGPKGKFLWVRVGAYPTCLTGINNAAGKIVGRYWDQPAYGTVHSFVWNYLPDLAASAMTTPASLSISVDEIAVPGARWTWVSGINSQGIIAGTAEMSDGATKGFIGRPMP